MKRMISVPRHEASEDLIGGISNEAMLAAGHAGDELRVEYTQTRTINVSQDALIKNRIVAGSDDISIVNAYKMLRTRILQRMKANAWTTLAVTSPAVGDGKTLSAANLAISIAKEVNHTVLLVDLDLRRPSIARYFNCEPEYGLCDYLLGNIELTDILFTPGIDRLAILPGGRSVVDSSELLSAPKMVRLAQELKNRYEGRVVIYDMPPLLMADDVLAFAPYVDAALLVLQEGKTRKEDLKKAMEMLEVVNVIGTILNKSQYKKLTYY